MIGGSQRRALPQRQSGEMKIFIKYLISLSGNRTNTLSCLHSHACALAQRLASYILMLYLYSFGENKPLHSIKN